MVSNQSNVILHLEQHNSDKGIYRIIVRKNKESKDFFRVRLADCPK